MHHLHCTHMRRKLNSHFDSLLEIAMKENMAIVYRSIIMYTICPMRELCKRKYHTVCPKGLSYNPQCIAFLSTRAEVPVSNALESPVSLLGLGSRPCRCILKSLSLETSPLLLTMSFVDSSPSDPVLPLSANLLLVWFLMRGPKEETVLRGRRPLASRIPSIFGAPKLTLLQND